MVVGGWVGGALAFRFLMEEMVDGEVRGIPHIAPACFDRYAQYGKRDGTATHAVRVDIRHLAAKCSGGGVSGQASDR